MSPELLVGEPVTAASDVFSFGVILARAAGVRPFGEGPHEALGFRAVHQEPDLTGLDPHLAGIVRRCLAKQPAARPTPADLLDLLATDIRSGPWLPPAVQHMVTEHAVPPSLGPPPSHRPASAPPGYGDPELPSTPAARSTPAPSVAVITVVGVAAFAIVFGLAAPDVAFIHHYAKGDLNAWGGILAGLVGGGGTGLVLSLFIGFTGRTVSAVSVILADLVTCAGIVLAIIFPGPPRLGVLAFALDEGAAALIILFIVLDIWLQTRDAYFATRARSRLAFLSALGDGVGGADIVVLGSGAIGAVLGAAPGVAISSGAGYGDGVGLGCGFGVILGIALWLGAAWGFDSKYTRRPPSGYGGGPKPPRR